MPPLKASARRFRYNGALPAKNGARKKPAKKAKNLGERKANARAAAKGYGVTPESAPALIRGLAAYPASAFGKIPDSRTRLPG